MKEILINSISNVSYTVYVDGIATSATGTPLAQVYEGEVLVLPSATVVSGGMGIYKFIMPPELVKEEKILTVKWTFTVSGHAMTAYEKYDVVTPYSQWDYFKTSNAGITYDKYLESERIARKVIDSYCGQSFGNRSEVIDTEGNNGNAIRLTKRLIKLDAVTWISQWYSPDAIVVPDYPVTSWDITADGWILRTPAARDRLDAATIPYYSFKNNITYSIFGTWGWDQVPTSVEEASKILTANFLCQDQKYRDKYLDTLKTGDWNIRFSPLAFAGTGSATADDLLLDYRISPGIGVI